MKETTRNKIVRYAISAAFVSTVLIVGSLICIGLDWLTSKTGWPILPSFCIFRQVVWSDDDFMVIADYTPQWPQYTVYERITMQSIGTTNCNYYMGQVRQIIHMHKKRMIQEFNV